LVRIKLQGILGNKTFAPDTIGISLSAEPGHRPKRVEVLKQHQQPIMRTWEIADKAFSDFNDYKYSNPEAFYYWHKALQ
jgi:hypothetical protein